VNRVATDMDLQNGETFRASILSWFDKNGREFPWRETHDAFKILIAEVTLKLTGAWKAQRVYEQIVAKYGTVARMANADLAELVGAFKPLGLVSRATLLIGIARELNDRFSGDVPKTYDELVSIKGIGHYIANAILCFAYDQRVPLVDESVSRIFRRCFGFHTNKKAFSDKELWHVAQDLLPQRMYREYNLGLLDIGALVCTHIKQRCSDCPISGICVYYAAEQETANLEVGNVSSS